MLQLFLEGRSQERPFSLRMSLMRPVPLAALALAALPLFAQEKIEVSVVNVDVNVTDHGKPVNDLTRDDFEVFEDGAPQALTNFYAVDDRQSLTDGRFRRRVLLLIDRNSITRFEYDRALARLEAYISDQFSTGEYEWSIAVMDTSLKVLLPPTADKRAILSALHDIRQGQKPDGFASLAHWNIAGVDAIVEAARSFAAASGKKILVVLTGQMSDIDDIQAARYHLAYTRDELIQEANASNVNIYIVNPEGAENSDSSMYWIAHSTGGRVLTTSKVDQALNQFDTASSNFYSLGFSPKHPDDEKYHHLKVRVKKGDYVLQYRDGYFAIPEQKQIERTVGSSFGTFWVTNSDLPVSISFSQKRDVDDAVILTMDTTAAGAGQPLGTVDIFISLFDSDGRSVWSVHKTREANASGKLNETTEIYLHKGKPYKVIVAVHDRTSETLGVTQQVVQF